VAAESAAAGIISPLHRTIATILMLSATAGVAWACGGSKAASDAGARDAASAATGPTSVGSGQLVGRGSKVSVATLSLGEAVNLRRSDAPGMTRIAPESENKLLGLAAALSKCGGGGTVSLVEQPGGIHSATLTKGVGTEEEVVRSVVRVAQSAATAANQLSANRSASVLACYQRLLRSRSSGPSVASISVSSLPNPLQGVPGSFAYRLSTRASVSRGAPVAIYQDVFGFAVGRAQIELNAIRASRPVSAATERRLLSLLLSRAKANEP
jgi:hypothetical protein